MSNRLESRSFVLWQRGHSLGLVWWCFRLPTTSRKLLSVPIDGLWLLRCVSCLIGLLCCLLGSLVGVRGSLLFGLGGRLGV